MLERIKYWPNTDDERGLDREVSPLGLCLIGGVGRLEPGIPGEG